MKIFKKFKQIFSQFSRFEKLLAWAPLIIWFSYYPNFHIGRAEGMNMEFSIALLYLLALSLEALPGIWRNRQQLISNRVVLLTGSFVLLNGLSFLWTPNLPRAILTTGLWGVLWLIFCRLLLIESRQVWASLKRIYTLSAVLMGFLALFQVIYGTWVDFGLCSGCLARGFGFTRPSVFTIEPQFFGSLLLAPIILTMYDLIIKKANPYDFRYVLVMLTALYLTLSRGAIFALALALIVMSVVIITTKVASFGRTLGLIIGLVAIGFTSGLVIHGVFTELNPRVTDGFYDSISKSINHMTLGIVKLPEIDQPIETPAAENSASDNYSPDNQAPTQVEALFDGYVERSTDERTILSNLAFKTWLKDPWTMIFGVGAGGSGRAIYEYTRSTGWEYEIVQNQYLEILLENGLLGVVIFAAIIIGFFKVAKHKAAFIAIMIAFLVQWNFFSGLPNATHVYLILAIIFATIKGAYEKESHLHRRVYPAK